MNLKSALFVSITFPIGLYAQVIKDSTDKNWSGSAAGYCYFIEGEEFHPTIIGITDYKWLHLETRYNYEDVNTASLFAGYNWENNCKADVSITPMIGIATGNTNGLLPGLEFNITYSGLNLYSENEYMLDFKGRQNDFFYSWTQLSTNVFKNAQAGLIAESLRWYKTKFDVQRGVYGEYNIGNFTFDVYYFNPLSGYDYVVSSLTYEF